MGGRDWAAKWVGVLRSALSSTILTATGRQVEHRSRMGRSATSSRGMVLGIIGLAVAFNSLWLLLTLVPFALVIRYGVVAREEAYLERKFGDVYGRYRARVRRWL